eukprot:CAMPEP_0170474858 /NCGR_PEP_ID=MMETSP0123-20130129/16602_1 /TAXON_ID=182087 /ORGANISM="Favella ehrenbergii, Strain Fehren 1" /LENGTH=62 /DNA_ID=CAMNT_0010744975 /DNA_START=289 /DNA_END=477 /DNA_ORIENTATION=+
MTDNGKFGSTYSAKKVSLEGPSVADPFSGAMYGAGAMNFDDEPFDPDADEQMPPMPDDSVET